MSLPQATPKRSLRVHVWVPELVLKRGGIQTFSRCLIEALVEILGSDGVQVMAKNDPGIKSEERFAGRELYGGRPGASFASRPREAGDSVSVETELGAGSREIQGKQIE